MPNILASSPFQSPYDIHQEGDELHIDIDLPGVAAQDIQVQVLNPTNCVIEWTADRPQRRPQRTMAPRIGGQYKHSSNLQEPTTFRLGDRFQLGRGVNCEQLAANLSRGILTLTAPIKESQKHTNENQDEPRSVPIELVN